MRSEGWTGNLTRLAAVSDPVVRRPVSRPRDGAAAHGHDFVIVPAGSEGGASSPVNDSTTVSPAAELRIDWLAISTLPVAADGSTNVYVSRWDAVNGADSATVPPQE